MNFRYYLLILLILPIFLSSLCDAQSLPHLQKIEEKVEKRRKELGIPGISLAIVKDGQIIFMKGFGYKDFEKKIPVTPDTQFGIGSVTKSFTALSVLMSADERKVSLDDNPKKYLPYFKIKDPETDKNIKIRDILSHSSGINRMDLALLTSKLTRQELIRLFGEVNPAAKLREKFFYNNIMFAAAGEIVAQTHKMTWEKYVVENIFNPLGMTNSTISIPQLLKAKDYSFGYDYNSETKETEKLPFHPTEAISPAGSINSSARDMAKWINFLINGGEIKGKRLVSQELFSEWIKPQIKVTENGEMSYGLGWYIQNWNDLKVVGHGGNIDGFHSMVAMIPEKKIGFVMLANVSDSPLGFELLPFIWESLLDFNLPTDKNPTAQKEVGEYHFAEIGGDIDVQFKNDKLIAQLPGQSPVTLQKISDRKYKVVEVQGYLVTFGDDSLILESPGGTFILPKRQPNQQKSDETKPKETSSASKENLITADELMTKALEASGGEVNWRKITSRITTSKIDAVQQGVKGETTSYAKFPNKTAAETNLTAFNKLIGKGWSFFDGIKGEEFYSFIPSEKFSEGKLDNARINSDFYFLMNWKSNFKTAEIKGVEKVGGEECFVIEFVSEKGTKITDYYSTKTFLLIQRQGKETSGINFEGEPYKLVFSDYRKVDGLLLPFKTIKMTESIGEFVTVVTSIKHNVAINDKLFSHREIGF